MILSSSLYIGAGYYIYHQSAWDSLEGFSITLILLFTFQLILEWPERSLKSNGL